MPDATLDEVLQYGLKQQLPPEQIAGAVKAWHADTVTEGRALVKDPLQYWQGTHAVDADVQAALSGISGYAQERKAREFFPDPAQRQQFINVLASSNHDPDQMDAPPEWQAAGKAVADAGAPFDANPTPTQAGTIGVGPNSLASYDIRAKEDGTGYEALILPVALEKGKKPQPFLVNLPPLPVMQEQAKAKFDQASRALELDNNMGGGAGFMGEANVSGNLSVYPKYKAAKSRYDLLTGNDLSAALHTGLDTALTQTPAFLEQIPNKWVEQFTTRPVVGVVRSLAQAAAGATGINKAALTAEGQAAMDIVTPGALRNRFEAGDSTPIADQISQGIESSITLFGPTLITKAVTATAGLTAAGRAARVATALTESTGGVPFATAKNVTSGAGWAGFYTTAYGSSYAGAQQEADALEPTDPARAARIRRLAQWTSLTNAAIELASERIFPDEAKLMRGQRMPWKSIALMPAKEWVEEYVGANFQNVVANAAGQQEQDPLKAGMGGFFGSLPMMGGATIARAIPQRNIGAPNPTAPTAPAPANPAAAAPAAAPVNGTQPAPPTTTYSNPSAPIAISPPAISNPAPVPAGSPISNPAPVPAGSQISDPQISNPQNLAAIAARGGTVDQTSPFPVPTAPTAPTPQDPMGTVPESAATLAAQFQRVAAGIEPAMTIPGATLEQLPPALTPQPGDGLTAMDTPAGVAILPAANVPTFTAALQSGNLGEALGYGIGTRPDTPTGAVVLRNAQGVEVKAVEVDESTRAQVKATLHDRAQPGDTLTDESIPDVAAARQAPDAQAPSAIGDIFGTEDETAPEATPEPAPVAPASTPAAVSTPAPAPAAPAAPAAPSRLTLPTPTPIPAGVRPEGWIPDSMLPSYFTPGSLVVSSSGMVDRVESFTPASNGNGWSVRVREQQRNADGTYSDMPGAWLRTHYTHPTYREASRAGIPFPTAPPATTTQPAAAPRARTSRAATTSSAATPRPAVTPMPRPSARARMIAVWKEIAQEAGSLYGWTDSADIADIAAAVATPEDWITITPTGNGLTIETRSGPMYITRQSPGVYKANTSRMQGSATAGQRSTGSQAYLAAFLWARNNNYKFISSDLWPINILRRTSNMISFALRRLAAGDPNFTSHSDPAPEQGVRWQGTDTDKLIALLLKEVDNVRAAVPEFDDLTYDRRSRSFRYQGNPISDAALTGLQRDGFGSATIRRAVITQWALDNPVRPSRSGRGGQAGAVTSTTGVRAGIGQLGGLTYSQQNPGTPLLSAKTSNPAKAAAEAVTALSNALPGLVTERVHFVANPDSLTSSGYAPEGYFTPEERAAMATAEGVHDPRTGRTIIFTDNVTVRPGETPRSAVARVILHERVGHDGVNHLLATDKDFRDRWDKLTEQIPQEELDDISADYGHLNGDRAQLGLEWLARQAEAIESARNGYAIDGLAGLPRQMWETIKAFLAKAFQNFSRRAHRANEVRDLITRARQAALSGTAIPTSPEALQFSLGGTAVIHADDVQNPWLRRRLGLQAGEPFRVNKLGLRTILTGSPLPRAFVDTVRGTERARRAADSAAAQIGRDLQAATESVAARTGLPLTTVHGHLNGYMDGAPGAGPTLAALDPVLAERARRARNYLDDLSTAIAQTLPVGDLQNTVLGNIGTWMRRSYAAFDSASGWNYDALDAAAQAGQPLNGVADPARIMRDARNFLRQQAAANNQPAPTAAELEADLRDLMDRDTVASAFTGARQNASRNSQVRKNISSLIARQDIPAELRALMGEETNALHRFTQSAGFQVQFLQRHEGQQALRTLGLANGLFQTQRGGVFTEEIPGTNGENHRWTPLAGLWTTPQLMKALATTDGGATTGTDLGGLVVKTLHWLGNESKLNKVALSPDSWMVNILGNVTSVINSGDVFYGNILQRIGTSIDLMRAGRARSGDVFNAAAEAIADANRAMSARLQSSGVLGESFNLRNLEETIPRQMLQWVADDSKRERALGAVKGAILGQAALRGLGAPGRAAGAVAGGLAGAAAGYNTIIGWQNQLAGYVMTAPDALGRLTGFMGNLEAAHASGLTGNDAFDWASERTRNTFPDYGKMPPVMKELSRLGFVGSFIAFQYEVYRNFAWNSRYAVEEIRSQNPALQKRGAARMIGTAAIGGLAVGGLGALIGAITGTSGDDDRNRIYRKYFAAPWEKNGNLAFTKFDQTGVTYFNSSYLLPQGTMAELINAAREGENPADSAGRVVEQLWNQFAGSSVHMDPLLQAYANRDGRGRAVSNQRGIAGILERIDTAGQTILEPGLTAKLERITYALRDATRKGRSFSVEEEAKRLVGIRSYSRNWDQLAATAYHNLASEGNAIRAEGQKILDNNLPGAPQRALEQTNAALATIREKIATFESDAARLGLPPALLREARKGTPKFTPVQLDPKNPRRLKAQ